GPGWGLLEPRRRKLVIFGAFASETERFFYRGSLGSRRRAFTLSATREDRNAARAQRQLWRLMTSKTEETPQKEEMKEKEGPESVPDSPLLDPSDAAVRELVRSAQKRGYVTHDQIDSVLPSEGVNPGQIEDVLALFSEMGIKVVETEEPGEEGEEPHEESDEEAERERRAGRGPAEGPGQIRGQGADRAHG